MKGGVRKATTRSAAKKMEATLINQPPPSASHAVARAFVHAMWDDIRRTVDVCHHKNEFEKLGWPATVAEAVSRCLPQKMLDGIEPNRGLHSLLFAVFCIKGGRKTSEFDSMLASDMAEEMVQEVEVRNRNFFGKLMLSTMRHTPDQYSLINELYIEHYDAMKALWRAKLDKK